jgi:hypothetical protein
LTTLLMAGSALAAPANKPLGDMSMSKSVSITRGVSKEGKACLDCHKKQSPGIVLDWKESRHAHAGVTCIDCHGADKNSATGFDHMGGKVSILVPPSTCAACHQETVNEFNRSGHFRAYRQIIPKDSLHALVNVHEGRSHPEFGGAPNETGCIQCHGTELKVDQNGRPTPETWPNAGMGNIYPDGSTGNCSTCHTRHRYSVAEARKPEACSSCHLGPDHPNIEIYENSKHGHIYMTQGDEWNYDSAPDAWEPGDYRGPTCTTCHMSGIGELATTHNISERLYWVLWAKESKVRNSPDPMSPITGDGPEGRKKMMQVCQSCHGGTHTKNAFAMGDKAVNLYNEAYWKPAKKMLDELKEKGLLKENPWTDDFQITFYYLWHHQGRRARMAALHQAPDYAHWHGFFELQQDLYKLEHIHATRLKTGKIEGELPDLRY